MPMKSPRHVAASERAKRWGHLFVWTTILTGVAAAFQLRQVPSERDLSYAEGVVTKAKLIGGRSRRFTFQIAGRTETFQSRLGVAGGAAPPEVVGPGAKVRAGHTGATAGLTGHVVVYSLEVNGSPVYTFDQYRSAAAEERRRFGAVAVASAGVAAFTCFQWRRWRSRVGATTGNRRPGPRGSRS
jgi:hypothetical protein